ncbi:MAG: hypothetical protein H0T89_11670 [Deltaproteobacteria bacterium]|nr:hypothetical protein [Deltaproteobacteria bacterium]MDQ3298061.1 hypothetical protein [Myxococcota bacterium]
MKAFLWMTIAITLGCKTPNPERCCVDAADCASQGLDEEMRTCAEGLACVANECVVASCSTQGCAASAPVCDIASDICEGCSDAADCARFASEQVCDVGSGRCLQCLTPADCGPTTPVCDANACRGCSLDSECESGACGDDGACIAATSVVYLDPSGTDTGDCTDSQPCRSVPFAVSRTNAARSHLVMRTGVYAMTSFYELGSQQTSAASLIFHGGGSSLVAAQYEGPKLLFSIPVTIRDLTISIEVGRGLSFATGARYVLERVNIRANSTGLEIEGDVTVRDFVLDVAPARGGTIAVTLGSGAALTLERGSISGFATAIGSLEVVSIQAINVLIHGANTRAVDLPQAQGSMSFVTIADSGTNTGDGPRAVACGPSMTISGSIIWAPGTSARVPVSGCNLVSSIAGPTPIAGIPNSDPRFVDAAARDYHLRSDSPAKDMVAAGPNVDFESDPRPRGTRFDAGADEAP